MKKLMALFIALSMMLTALTACGAGSQSQQLANPFTTYETVEAAKEAASFNFAEPERLPDSDYRLDSVLLYQDGSMVQLNYKDDSDVISLRVSNTMSPSDLNGDYNKYSNTGAETTKYGTEITWLGDERDEAKVAMWTQDGLNYCMMSNDDIDVDDIVRMVESIPVRGGVPASSEAAGGSASAAPQSETAESAAQSGTVGLVNPITEYDSVEAAAAAAGFEFKQPTQLPDRDYKLVHIAAYNDKSMVQLTYRDEDDSDKDEITLRASNTLTPDDLNGDYNTYSYNNNIQSADGTQITAYGNERDDVNVALWTQDGISYCMMSTDDIDIDEVTALVNSMGIIVVN